ncbi:MAG: inositol monophosphatase [Sedimentisphaerales bacterium]|nr:inositol monophosphatase [Sedimentisphaerales bacterium]
MQNFIQDIARQAGQISLQYRSRLAELNVTAKPASSKDLVTEADRAVETYLRDAITKRYPTHAILGEEFGTTPGQEYRWIIDPIDGTTSFVHNQPFYSISIALHRNDAPYLAAVYAPVFDELFSAQKNHGAQCNGKPIRVSNCRQLDQAVLGTGFACMRANLTENNLPYFQAILPKIRDVRRLGSAAIDLCYVASGRLDAFWELHLQTYDVAAGTLIVTEAGGTVSDFHNQTKNLPQQLLATNTHLHAPLSRLLTNVTP